MSGEHCAELSILKAVCSVVAIKPAVGKRFGTRLECRPLDNTVNPEPIFMLLMHGGSACFFTFVYRPKREKRGDVMGGALPIEITNS